jgi:cytochrome c-type biogenesis protein CcmE
VFAAVAVFAVAVMAVALRENISYYRLPGELRRSPVPPDMRLRLGGYVKEGSLDRKDPQRVVFKAVDDAAEITVIYRRKAGEELPDLFKEGQGMVAEGYLVAPDEFRADRILARHDERYMSRDVADKLKEIGHWQGDETREGQQGDGR